MTYIKTVWKDQNVENPRTYIVRDNGNDTVTLIDAFGTVTEIGTPVNATNMNHIEDGIADLDINKASDIDVVHKTGAEDIYGNKTIKNTLIFSNSNNPTIYTGYEYQQSGGDYIIGLRAGSTWLNYIQFGTDGSINTRGTLKIPTPSLSSVSTEAVNAEWTLDRCSNIMNEPLNSTSLFLGDLNAGDIQLSEDFMNFNELEIIFTDDTADWVDVRRISTYEFDKMLSSNYGAYYTMLFRENAFWDIRKYSGGTTRTLLKYASKQDMHIKEVNGLNRKSTT